MSRGKPRCSVPVLILLLTVSLAPVRGATAGDRLDNDEWSFVIAPYGWILAADGDATIRGTKAEIDQSSGDILRNIDIVMEARLEARKGDWAFLFDPTLAFLSDEAEAGPIEVDINSRLILVLFGVSRTLYNGPFGPGSAFDTRIEAGIGGIYVRADSEIDLPSPLPDPDFEESWIDPALTFRVTTKLNERWRWRVAGLVGGFGIGEASQLSLGVETFLGRRIGENKTIWFGYRALSIDYERGSGLQSLEFDMILHGPTIGLSFHF